jgi:hypothetical protein
MSCLNTLIFCSWFWKVTTWLLVSVEAIFHNPTLREVWSRHSHSRKWDLGILRDFRKLKTRLQGPKHLALRCFLYCWKGLEVYMSKMALHESFGHLQHKLWSKEGPGIKLAVWLLTTKKSGIDPTPICAGGMRHTIGKFLRRATNFL